REGTQADGREVTVGNALRGVPARTGTPRRAFPTAPVCRPTRARSFAKGTRPCTLPPFADIPRRRSDLGLRGRLGPPPRRGTTAMPPMLRRLSCGLAAACLLLLSGCFGVTHNPSYFPYNLSPFGDIVRTHGKPAGPGYYHNFD